MSQSFNSFLLNKKTPKPTNKESLMQVNSYAIAIRRISTKEGQAPVIIVKRGLSVIEARQRAEAMNRTHRAECVALGGSCFVAYNERAM